tara:strand:+ start:167 stop:436 length:270 start_codon:yes stop_codon:yes gene_type:complete
MLYPAELRAHGWSIEPDGSRKMVGVEGFEPPTFCSQSRRATRLRYTPMSCCGGVDAAFQEVRIIPMAQRVVNDKTKEIVKKSQWPGGVD